MAAFDWHGGRITRRTPVTADYCNTQNARRFFKTQCGKAFKFDRPFMAWLKSGIPRTIGDAAGEWRRRRRQGTNERPLRKER